MKAKEPICLVLMLLVLAVGCKKEEPATPEALCQAVRAGDIKRVRSLVSSGVDVNRTKAGLGPLHHAAMCGHKHIAELLIAKGAEVDFRERYGSTPLLLALWEAHESVARLLVASGADVNAMDRYDYTPLLYAFRCDNGDMAALLIRRGAAVDVSSRMRPYEPAVAPDAMPHMPYPFVYTYRPLHYAAMLGYKNVAELLIAGGADVNTQNCEKVTPLHEAASRGHRGMVDLLLANGADVNAKTKDGWTPVDIALSVGYKDLAQSLRSAGGESGAGKDAGGKWTDGLRYSYIVRD